MVRQVMTMKMPGKKKTKIRRMGLRFIVIQFLMRRARMLVAEGRVSPIFHLLLFLLPSSTKSVSSSLDWLKLGIRSSSFT